MVCVCVCVSCVCSVGCVPWSTSAYLHLDEALGRCCVCSVCVCVRGVVEWCSTIVAYLRHGFIEAEDIPFNG